LSVLLGQCLLLLQLLFSLLGSSLLLLRGCGLPCLLCVRFSLLSGCLLVCLHLLPRVCLVLKLLLSHLGGRRCFLRSGLSTLCLLRTYGIHPVGFESTPVPEGSIIESGIFSTLSPVSR
jgi:hypothetical protein